MALGKYFEHLLRLINRKVKAVLVAMLHQHFLVKIVNFASSAMMRLERDFVSLIVSEIRFECRFADSLNELNYKCDWKSVRSLIKLSENQ